MATDIKTRRSLLPPAARTATIASPQQKDAVQQFLRIYLNVTAASGTGGLTVTVRGYDILGNAAKLSTGGGAAITATGMSVFELGPSAAVNTTTDVKETQVRLLPCVWDVLVTAGDGTSYTYSLSCEVFPG